MTDGRPRDRTVAATGAAQGIGAAHARRPPALFTPGRLRSLAAPTTYAAPPPDRQAPARLLAPAYGPVAQGAGPGRGWGGVRGWGA